MYTKYTKEILEHHAKDVNSFAGLARSLGKSPVGGTTTHLRRSCERLEVDVSHFTGQGHRKGKQSNNRKSPEDIFVVLPDLSPRPKAAQLRRALTESGVEYKCSCCGISSWNNQQITLQVDHKDGNFLNNVKENLRFLCPNCHSQTETWGNKAPLGK